MANSGSTGHIIYIYEPKNDPCAEAEPLTRGVTRGGLAVLDVRALCPWRIR
jgi:hypothetical protein